MGYVKAGPWRRDFCRLRPRGVPPESVAASASLDWDQTSERFADKPHYLNRFLGELKFGAYLQLIQRWGGLPASGRVLKTDLFEEALGPDALLPALSGNGRVAIGMDVSVALTRRARAREGSGTLRCVAGDSRRLPFADDTFALIVSPSTLDHFSDEVDLGVSLRELARVLEPGGRLIITLDNRQNVFDPLLRLAHRVGWVPYYLGRSYRVTELREELSGAGLEVEATTAILHNPRLVAVAAVRFATNVGWLPLTRIVERTLRGAQRLEDTPLCYFTGSFVAAKALKPMTRATGG
jgi:SAM-dependent methyltransferase